MLPGIRAPGEQDSYTMRDGLAPRVYHTGGVRTLSAGDVVDLVKVSDLKRFETMKGVARGTHTGSSSTTTLTDSSATFLDWGVQVGDTAYNETGNSSGVITAVTNTTLDVTGVTWASTNVYRVDKTASHQGAQAIEIRRFSVVTDRDIQIRVDGVPSTNEGFDAQIKAGEAYTEENVRVVSRIVVKAVSSSDTPEIRYTAWGV